MATAAPTLTEVASSYVGEGERLAFAIDGIPPGMLMHAGTSQRKQEQAAEDARAKGARGKFIPSHEQSAEWAAYRDEDGRLYLPATNLVRSCIEAGKAFRQAKSRASLKYAVAAGVFAPAGILGWPLTDPETGDDLTTYEVHVARVIVQKQAVEHGRAHLPAWRCEGEIMLDPNTIPAETFAQVLGYAGARVGVGDWRPERGGQYGRFQVVKLEVVQ